jgi:hypothetical protein
VGRGCSQGHNNLKNTHGEIHVSGMQHAGQHCAGLARTTGFGKRTDAVAQFTSQNQWARQPCTDAGLGGRHPTEMLPCHTAGAGARFQHNRPQQLHPEMGARRHLEPSTAAAAAKGTIDGTTWPKSPVLPERTLGESNATNSAHSSSKPSRSFWCQLAGGARASTLVGTAPRALFCKQANTPLHTDGALHNTTPVPV